MTQDNTPQFPHREPFPLIDGGTREQAIEIVDWLLRLEQETHPRNSMVNGRVTGAIAGKDENSRLAFMVANDLVELLAGWAINHQIGLVLNGTPGGAAAPHDGGYSEAQRKADNHVHEATAAGYDFSDTKINRHILTELLDHGPGPFPISIIIEATDAFAALDMGEVQPFVAPARGVGKEFQSYTKWNLRYRAVLHVEYLRGMNHPRPDALGKVADAYGVESGTVEWWIRDVRKKLGNLPIKEMKGRVRRVGKTACRLKDQAFLSDQDKRLFERLSSKWGSVALTRNGNEFQQIPQPKDNVAPLQS